MKEKNDLAGNTNKVGCIEISQIRKSRYENSSYDQILYRQWKFQGVLFACGHTSGFVAAAKTVSLHVDT
jgi:hypothetical protein